MKTFKALMEERGYNKVTPLAEQTGLSRARINDLKNGKSYFSKLRVYNAIKIAKALNMTVEEIYNYLYEE